MLLEISQWLNNPMIMTILIVFAIFVAVRIISGVAKLAFKLAIIAGAVYLIFIVFRAVTGT